MWRRLMLAAGAGAHRLVAVGNGGQVVSSDDGITWTARSSGVSAALHGAKVIQEKYIALCSGTLNAISSTDGEVWEAPGVALPGKLDLAYGGGTYVVVGSYNTSQLASGPSLVAVTERDLGVTFGIQRIAYGNGLFVTVAAGNSYHTSADGISWTSRTSENTSRLAYGGGLFAAAGDSGLLKTSPDGITWTGRSNPTPMNCYAALYAGGLFVLAGNSGRIITSPDGLGWTARTSNLGTNDLQALGWSAALGLYIVGSAQGTTATSPDGVTWTPRATLFGGGPVNAFAAAA